MRTRTVLIFRCVTFAGNSDGSGLIGTGVIVVVVAAAVVSKNGAVKTRLVSVFQHIGAVGHRGFLLFVYCCGWRSALVLW